MTLEEQQIYGQNAALILENPVWKDVWQQYRQQIQEALMSTPVSDVDGLQKAVQALQIMHNLQAMIEDTMATGKMAAQQMREKSAWEKIKDSVGISHG